MIEGDYAYVADGTSLQILDISDPDNPSFTGSAVLAFGTGVEGRGVAVLGSFAYVAHSQGLEVFNISNPSSPVSVYMLSISGIRDITIEGDLAYVVGGVNGLNILNLSKHRTH